MDEGRKLKVMKKELMRIVIFYFLEFEQMKGHGGAVAVVFFFLFLSKRLSLNMNIIVDFIQSLKMWVMDGPKVPLSVCIRSNIFFLFLK